MLDLLQNQRLVETGNKVKVVFEAADSLLDQTDIKKSHMSILYTEGGLSFCLLNKEKKKYILLGHYKAESETDQKDLFEFLDRFQEMPDRVSLAVLDSQFTIVPKSLFDKNQVSTYLKFSNSHVNAEVTFKEINDMVLVHEDPAYHLGWLADRIPHIELLNNAEVALHYYMSKKTTGTDYLSINCFNNYLEILFVSNGKLELYNTFGYDNKEDLVYYILSVYEQLKLNPELVALNISGSITRKSEEVKLLKQYIKQINWEDRPVGFQYSYTFNTQEEHFNNRLFQQYLCVL